MTADCMLDTNVLAYMYDSSNPIKQQKAIQIVDYWVRKKRVAISVQVLSEFAVIASKKLNPPLTYSEIMASVERLSGSMIVLPLTTFIVQEAVRGANSYQMSYWDAQIWAAARMNQIPLIFTEDIPGQSRIEGVSYENPFAE